MVVLEIPEICYWLDDEKRILIGGCPYDQDTFDEIVSLGVDVFINLMADFESKRLMRYSFHEKMNDANIEYKSIPIMDRYILENDELLMRYVDKLLDRVIKLNQKIYVFCDNGHGRAGVFAAMLLHRLHPKWDYKTVLANLRDKHKYMIHQGGAMTPQTTPQYNQIYRIITNHYDIFFHDPKDTRHYLSNYYTNKNGSVLFVDDEGEPWYSVEAYYQAHKFMHSEKGREYAKWIQKADSPFKAHLLGQKDTRSRRQSIGYNHCVSKKDPMLIRQLMMTYAREPTANKRENWNTLRDGVMRKALMYKFKQNPWMKRDLLKTGMVYLRHYMKDDSYWGEFWNNQGENRLGKMLMDIRSEI